MELVAIKCSFLKLRYRHCHHLLLLSFSNFLYLNQHKFFLVIVFIIILIIKFRLCLFLVCRLQPESCNSLHLALFLICHYINVSTTLVVDWFWVYLLLLSRFKTNRGCRCRNFFSNHLSIFLSLLLWFRHFILVHSSTFIYHQDRKHSYTLFGVKIN